MFKAVVYGQAVRQDTIEIAKLRRFPTWFRWIDRDDVVKLRDAVNWKKKRETITVIESRDWLKEMLLDFE